MARILIGNIKGPKGDTGAQGPQGPVGPQGPQGPLPPLVNNALATEAGVAALDAAMGKTLQEQVTNNKNDITELNSNLGSMKSSEAGPDEIPASQWYSLQNKIELDPGTYIITGSLSGAGEQAGKYTGFQFFNETDNAEFGNRELVCNPDGNTFGAVSTFCQKFGKKTNITMRCWTAVGYKLNGSSLKATKLK